MAESEEEDVEFTPRKRHRHPPNYLTEMAEYPRGESVDSWASYQRLVLAELQRLNNNYEKLSNDLSQQAVEVGKLTVKSGIFGALAGFLPVVLMLIIAWATGKLQ